MDINESWWENWGRAKKETHKTLVRIKRLINLIQMNSFVRGILITFAKIVR